MTPPPDRLRRSCRTARLFLLAALFVGPAAVAAPRLPEDEVKAAVVANLPLFVRWPAGAANAAHPQVCILAPGTMEAALLRQHREGANGNALDFKPVTAVPEQLRECAMVFVGASDPAALFRAAAAVAGRPVLLVAEGNGVLQRGAMIGLAVQEGRVAIDVNLGALRRAQLDVSAKLLRLARTVVE